MKKENATVYQKMDEPIKLQWEKEGRWLEFIIENKDATFEQMIADRRDEMFKRADGKAQREFAKIMNEYCKRKEAIEEAEAEAE